MREAGRKVGRHIYVYYVQVRINKDRSYVHIYTTQLGRVGEGGREGGREGGAEGGTEGGRKRGRMGGREEGREGRTDGWRDGDTEGEGGRE